MSAHTPGPWRVEDDHPSHACLHICFGEPFHGIDEQDRPKDYHIELATLYTHRVEVHADARLIAAAPDLLAALNTLLLNFGTVELGDSVAIDVARAAITKATQPCILPKDQP